MMVTVFFDGDKKEVLEVQSKLFTTISLPKLHSPLPTQSVSQVAHVFLPTCLRENKLVICYLSIYISQGFQGVRKQPYKYPRKHF